LPANARLGSSAIPQLERRIRQDKILAAAPALPASARLRRLSSCGLNARSVAAKPLPARTRLPASARLGSFAITHQQSAHAIMRLRPSLTRGLSTGSVRTKSTRVRRTFDPTALPSVIPQLGCRIVRTKSTQARRAFAHTRSRGLIHTPSRISNPRTRSCGFAHPPSRNLRAGSFMAKIHAGAVRFRLPAITR